jgi:ABC-2 type transport system ATP-binding protein
MSIHIHQVTKLYGAQKALDDISFNVSPGEIVGLLGPNGAGKSTLMKIITCFIPPTSGEVTVCGHDIFEESLKVREKVGYLPEHNPLYLEMYVREFLDFIAGIHHIGGKSGQRVKEMIELTGLTQEQHKKIGALSKGYRQRVGLAQALIHDPELVILDEPLHGLDPVGRRQLREKIVSLKEEGKTVFFSSHILSDVEAICDRVGMLFGGQLSAVGNIDSLLAKHLKSIEITVRDLPEPVVAKVKGIAAKFAERDSVYYLSVDSEEKGQEVLKIVQEAGGKLLAFSPQRASLEDYFMARSEKGGKA